VRRRVARGVLFGAVIAGIALGAAIQYFVAVPGTDEPAAAIATPAAAPADPAPPGPATLPSPAAGSTGNGAAEPVPETQQRQVRDVTPDGVTRVYMTTPATVTKPKPATSIQITNAGVKPNGSIVGDGGIVRLHGISFLEPMKTCTGASGEIWPCGRRAYISLHNKIASQTVHCEPKAPADPLIADCYLGETNLSAWLLGQGLARLSAEATDKDLLAAEAAAKQSRIGLWADPRESSASASGGRP
jgi:endonuclease YncB( thermonuclease family)